MPDETAAGRAFGATATRRPKCAGRRSADRVADARPAHCPAAPALACRPHATPTLATDQAHLLHPLHHPSAYAGTRVWVKGEGAWITDDTGRALPRRPVGTVERQHRPRPPRAGRCRPAPDGDAGLPLGLRRRHQRAGHRAGRAPEPPSPIPRSTRSSSPAAAPSRRRRSFKTARFYWKALGKPDKVKVISRHRAYHGLTLAAMSATGLPAFWPMFEPRVPGFLPHRRARPVPLRAHRPVGEPRRGRGQPARRGDSARRARHRRRLHRRAGAGRRRRHRAAARLLPAHPRDLRPSTTCCSSPTTSSPASAAPARWFGLEHYGVEPDIMQFAKGITSGYMPLGGIGVSDRVRDVMNGVPAGQALDARLHLLGTSDVLRGGAGQPRHHRARGAGVAGRGVGARGC